MEELQSGGIPTVVRIVVNGQLVTKENWKQFCPRANTGAEEFQLEGLIDAHRTTILICLGVIKDLRGQINSTTDINKKAELTRELENIEREQMDLSKEVRIMVMLQKGLLPDKEEQISNKTETAERGI